jgi:hypothetical protein
MLTAGNSNAARCPARLLKRPKSKPWTVLIQGLNLAASGCRRADAPLFAFIPYARLDDVMVSYATELAEASARISIPTMCSCSREPAGAAGRSARRRI